MTFLFDTKTKTIWKCLQIESIELCLDIPKKYNIVVCGVCEGKRTLPDKDRTIWNYKNLHNWGKHTIVCPNCVCLVGPDNINTDDFDINAVDINEICVNEYGGIDSKSVSFRPVISDLEYVD